MASATEKLVISQEDTSAAQRRGSFGRRLLCFSGLSHSCLLASEIAINRPRWLWKPARKIDHKTETKFLCIPLYCRRHKHESSPDKLNPRDLSGVIEAIFCITPYLLHLSFLQVAHLLSRLR